MEIPLSTKSARLGLIWSFVGRGGQVTALWPMMFRARGHKYAAGVGRILDLQASSAFLEFSRTPVTFKDYATHLVEV